LNSRGRVRDAHGLPSVRSDPVKGSNTVAFVRPFQGRLHLIIPFNRGRL
jgi:hypothetical protein